MLRVALTCYANCYAPFFKFQYLLVELILCTDRVKHLKLYSSINEHEMKEKKNSNNQKKCCLCMLS